jgi:hypothetical protein
LGNRPVAGIFSFGRKPTIKQGMKVRATWFLRTEHGRDIYKDLRGMATLKEGSNMPFEFIDGQHPFENKEALAIEVSSLLGANCVWQRGPDWIQEGEKSGPDDRIPLRSGPDNQNRNHPDGGVENRNDTLKAWEKFLDPQKLKQSLIEASIFITAYELLKEEIIDRPKSYFIYEGQDRSKNRVEYNKQVKALHKKDTFIASYLWLQNQGAMTSQDVELILQIREHRDEIAHELPRLIGSTELEVDKRLLECLKELITKISRWWAFKVDVPTNPDFDHVEVKEESVLTGSMMFMQVVMGVLKD